MNQISIPLEMTGLRKPIYAGFWPRLGAMLLDALCIAPFAIIIGYLNGLDKNVYYYTIVPQLAFSVWYGVYLTKRYGGTPGKLLCGLNIIRLDGRTIGWKEAFLRESVNLVITILFVGIMIQCLSRADGETFDSLNWLKRNSYLMSLSPFAKGYRWLTNIWVWSEFIVLLTNKRRRALHDFIAGTVVVRAMYIPIIREEMEVEELEENQ